MEKKKGINKSYLIILIGLVFIVAGIVSAVFLNGGSKKVEPKGGNEDKPVEVKTTTTPLMYEVTKEGSDTKIYLFGSIHVAEEGGSFPDYITNAYKASEYVACEYDILAEQTNPEAQQKQQEELKYKDGTTVKDHISEDTYNKAVAFLKENNVYNESIDQYKLFAWNSTITQLIARKAGLSTSSGIDIIILYQAKEDGKIILEVESSEFQSKLFDSFEDRLFEIMIIETIKNPDKSVGDLLKLYNAWKKGDPNEIYALSKSDFSDEVKQQYSEDDVIIMDDYTKRLLHDRNITMTDKFEEYFEKGYNTFYMVGVAHLVGDDGIANLLTQRGYKVTQVNK